MTSSISSTSMTPTKTPTKEEWLKKYEDRLTLVTKINDAIDVDFALDVQFEEGLPGPSQMILKGAMKSGNTNKFRVYMNLTKDRNGIFGAIQTAISEYNCDTAKYSLFLLNLMKVLPEIKPVEFSQYCLQFNTSYESNIPSQYWQVINNLNHAYSLTPDDLLSGLTLAQVQRIDIRTATPMGITKEQIENVKAKLSSENETSGTITPQRVKKRECLLA